MVYFFFLNLNGNKTIWIALSHLYNRKEKGENKNVLSSLNELKLCCNNKTVQSIVTFFAQGSICFKHIVFFFLLENLPVRVFTIAFSFVLTLYGN